ncbi:MAG: hypothetical protein U0414_23575 [Polyangiaceae bacterium]
MRLSSSFVALASVALLVGCTHSVPETAHPVASTLGKAPVAVSLDVELGSSGTSSGAAACDVPPAPASTDLVLARAETSFAKRGASAAVHFFSRDPEDLWELMSINGFQSTVDGLERIEMVDASGHGMIFTLPAAPGRYVCGRDGVRIEPRVPVNEEAAPAGSAGECEIIVSQGASGRLDARFKALVASPDGNQTIDEGWFLADAPDAPSEQRASAE